MELQNYSNYRYYKNSSILVKECGSKIKHWQINTPVYLLRNVAVKLNTTKSIPLVTTEQQKLQVLQELQGLHLLQELMELQNYSNYRYYKNSSVFVKECGSKIKHWQINTQCTC